MHTKNQFISVISVLSAHSMRLDRQAECRVHEYVLGSLHNSQRESKQNGYVSKARKTKNLPELGIKKRKEKEIREDTCRKAPFHITL